MPSILFLNNNIRLGSLDRFSNLFSSSSKNKPLSSQDASITLPNGDIRSILAQPEHIKIVCDHSLFLAVLGRQVDEEMLWCLAKRLKQQEDLETEYQEHSQSICYRRAIRIVIYYFRAHHHHPKYFKKCADVPEPCCCHSEAQETITEFQQSATNKIPQIPHPQARMMSTRTMSVSSYSTSSSYASSTASCCSNCGIEKRAMPVCARCKSQVYCSNHCRVAHKAIHQRECTGSQ
ncbi:hypothetical protein BJV82DRAFT_622842 [Fennellomyces sp. T-0311]|nr:hypothetical protein BJV82DRAFT_622842 [Fennellomyces sp. T-0311]